MNDAYVECLVKAKTSLLARFGRVFLTTLMVLLILAIFLMPPVMIFAFIGAVLCGVANYFLKLYTDLEYEYLYVDKELVVDKVMAKTKRKRIATYQLDSVEILAPIKSYHLDNYRNRNNVKEKDYSVREVRQPDERFVMFYDGGQKIILNPSPEMIRVMKNVAPRKVFSD